MFAGSHLFMRASVFQALQVPAVRKKIQHVLLTDPCMEKARIMAFISVLVESFILAEDAWSSGLCRSNRHWHQSRKAAVLCAVADFQSLT